VPAGITSALEPGETVKAVFAMSKGLQIYATDRRFFGGQGEKFVDVDYSEVTDVRRRRSRGFARGGIGVAFVAAGLLTGFDTFAASIVSVLLLLIGVLLLCLAFFMREHWVELRIKREGPRPSFGHVLMFFPFLLLLRHGRRYAAPGAPEQVEAFWKFLRENAPVTNERSRTPVRDD
jgi:hypothetical protein